ncbi:hypothetical protein Nepgr_006718 [Nepenthes gracilis]|uniref:Uncharacterized protein n=1 Tax=Nepenthes gracilis TaxID=150966 RepID=A0AAD3S5J2_NEPGR|nr:hypothetical protein Nepgr_006718 [Nepenthes gracilis]
MERPTGFSKFTLPHYPQIEFHLNRTGMAVATILSPTNQNIHRQESPHNHQANKPHKTLPIWTAAVTTRDTTVALKHEAVPSWDVSDLEDHSMALALKLSNRKVLILPLAKILPVDWAYLIVSLADEVVPSALGVVSDGVSHEVVVESQMGSLLADVSVGECYEDPASKKLDVSWLVSGTAL